MNVNNLKFYDGKFGTCGELIATAEAEDPECPKFKCKGKIVTCVGESKDFPEAEVKCICDVSYGKKKREYNIYRGQENVTKDDIHYIFDVMFRASRDTIKKY